jgi:hypothetical protein
MQMERGLKGQRKKCKQRKRMQMARRLKGQRRRRRPFTTNLLLVMMRKRRVKKLEINTWITWTISRVFATTFTSKQIFAFVLAVAKNMGVILFPIGRTVKMTHCLS